MRDTIVVNLFGGPGTAKSIFCALIFAKLKLKGVSAEMAREEIKNDIWKGDTYRLTNQQAIYSDQQRIVHSLKGKVDVVVCDAPLMNSILYDKLYNKDIDVDFHRMVENEFKRYNNRNFVLLRTMPYEKEGRYQEEAEAKEIDAKVISLLNEYGLAYEALDAWKESADVIARKILKELGVC
jgi:hypothetical protein